jgi:hypothetical protein
MDEQADPQARRLAEILVAAHSDADCAACLDELEAYIDAQLGGEEYAARFAATARHLDACVACAESYALIYEVRMAEAALPTPQRLPAPDLGFLLSPAERLRASLAAALSRAGAGLRLAFSPSLLAALAAAPAGPSLALRGDGPGEPLFELLISAPAPQVDELRLSLYADAARPGAGTLRAQLALAGRDWPDLAGVAVLARWPGGEGRATSDEWGEALIPGVPLDQLAGLVVEVEC